MPILAPKKKDAEEEKDGAVGALPRILPDLPDQVDGTKLRSLSKTKARSANLVDDVDFDDQELCHKVPNHILTLAYNTTSDPVIKSDIVKFNYSSDNIIKSTKNKDHSEIEMKFKNDDKVATADYNWKANSMATALEKMLKFDDYSFECVAHILSTMSTVSDNYLEFVGSLDLRVFHEDVVKKVVSEAREMLVGKGNRIDFNTKGVGNGNRIRMRRRKD